MCLIMNRLFGKQEKNMDSESTVIWSKRGKDTYFLVLDYLIENWSEREVTQFINRVELVIKTIGRNPQMFPASSHYKNIRKALIDKNNSLFYTIDSYKNRLILLTFYDNRQDPQKFKPY